MRDTIKEVLMERDEMTSQEADEAIKEAKERLNQLITEGRLSEAHDICLDEFGLEPDYLDELLF